jgi:tRNA uridine 5-carboxymethylaminomethyl modification enzyme
VAEQIEIQAKYQGYISRQQDEICRVAEHEQSRLPSDLDYLKVHGLSVEVQQKLSHTKPETLGQAMRVPGVTPAAISLLLVHLRRHAASLNPPA